MDLLGVDHDHEVSGIDVRRVGRLALAAQRIRDLGREPSERLPGCVDDQPLTVSVGGFGNVGLHGTHKPRDRRAACGQ